VLRCTWHGSCAVQGCQLQLSTPHSKVLPRFKLAKLARGTLSAAAWSAHKLSVFTYLRPLPDALLST
jgi:hypothetical protein